jgi:hypothetical protein
MCTIIEELTPFINRTLMNDKSKKQTIKMIEMIEFKIKSGQVLGNINQYKQENIIDKIIDILKGHSGMWSREVAINYFNLGYVYVTKGENIMSLNSWQRTSPSKNDKCFLVAVNMYPSLFIWNYQGSRYYEIVKIDLERARQYLDILKEDLKFEYTLQLNDNLIKINMFGNDIGI